MTNGSKKEMPLMNQEMNCAVLFVKQFTTVANDYPNKVKDEQSSVKITFSHTRHT